MHKFSQAPPRVQSRTSYLTMKLPLLGEPLIVQVAAEPSNVGDFSSEVAIETPYRYVGEWLDRR